MAFYNQVLGISTAAGVPLNHILLCASDCSVTTDPDPRTCTYAHLDLTTEQLGQTQRYNCWGFTFLPRRFWIGSAVDVDNIIWDNYQPVFDGKVQLGDVVRYKDNAGVTTHTGRVWQTDGTGGHATMVRSKWGSMGEYIHSPLDVPVIYGTNLAYFRQRSMLHGVADLWIPDSPKDDGGQCGSGLPWWTSPFIRVDAPPYDGAPDPNPVFDQPNRVWAFILNLGDRTVLNAYVRYYWADPAAGLAPADWRLIPATAEHPNPVGPLKIPGNHGVDAPYVEWIPTAASAHHCLMAIAYINDDPKDTNNPDPLVYPFDALWENNIAQRNVTVIEMSAGSTTRSVIGSRLSLPFSEKGSLYVVLTHRPRVPILGLGEKAVPLGVEVSLDGKRKSVLNRWDEPIAREVQFYLDRHRLGEQLMAAEVFGGVPFSAETPHELEFELVVPEEVKAGTVYHVHIAQVVGNIIAGGYTLEVVIV